MKKILIPLFIFAAPFLTHAQDATQFTFAPGSDTLSHHEPKPKYLEELHLEPIATSRADFSFRMFCAGRIIEVYKNGTEAWGTVSMMAYENGDYHTNVNIFKISFAINAEDAHSIINLINGSGLSSIPSENQIKDWVGGFDGTTYIFETKQNNSYSYKVYWSPEIQISPEAKQIQSFIEQLEKIAVKGEMNNAFWNSILFQSFSTGGGVFTVLEFTKEGQQLIARQKYMQERQAIVKAQKTQPE